MQKNSQDTHAHGNDCQVDLHTHSTLSDGGRPPSEIIQRAAEYGICVISLTDHATTDGLREAAEEASSLGLTFIPGIEMDSIYRNLDWHIVGYGIDASNKKLVETLSQIQQARKDSVRTTTEQLIHSGFEIDFQEVLDLGSHSLSKYHIVKVLMRRKANRDRMFTEIHPFPDIFEIIETYMGPGHEAAPHETKLSLQETIDLIKHAGGIPVLAHPGTHHDESDPNYPIDEVIKEIIQMGAQGIEAISPKHNYAEIIHFQKLAKQLGVITTAGSDYHGVDIPGVRHTRFRDMPYSVYTNLKGLLRPI